MTYAIGALLLIVGAIALALYPINQLGTPLVIAGALLIVLRAFGAVAADLPIPPPGVTHSQMRGAIADLERRKRMSRRKFERTLSSPIGWGHME